MPIYYSPSKKGFYLCDVKEQAPSDSVAVSNERHTELLELQSQGFLIEPGGDGAPIASRVQTMVVDASRVMEYARTIMWEAYGDEALKDSVHRYFTELVAKKASGLILTAEQEADFLLMMEVFAWEQATLDCAAAIISSGDLSDYQNADWPTVPAGFDALVAAC